MHLDGTIERVLIGEGKREEGRGDGDGNGNDKWGVVVGVAGG